MPPSLLSNTDASSPGCQMRKMRADMRRGSGSQDGLWLSFCATRACCLIIFSGWRTKRVACLARSLKRSNKPTDPQFVRLLEDFHVVYSYFESGIFIDARNGARVAHLL